MNSTPEVVPSAGVAVLDGDRILLVKRSDDGTWCLPGGRLDFGESLLACAHRECLEETGWSVTVGELLGIYSAPAEQTHRYPDGRLVQFVGAVFEAVLDTQVGVPDDEVVDVDWFAGGDLPENLFPPDALVIRDALSDGRRPFVR